MAGYSGTPLVRKLGIKPGFRIRAIKAPSNYFDLLGALPPDVQILSRGKQLDLVHIFAKDHKTLLKYLPSAIDNIKPNGMIWISWYKKSSRIPTDLTEDVIRGEALHRGLVDIKVCAVDDQWSGLKIVIRKENR